MAGARFIRNALVLLLGLSLAGCGDDVSEGAGGPQTLARVNGTPITSSDLAHLRTKMGAESVSPDKKFEVEKKLLETLVNRRAMALLMEQGMDKKAQEALATEVAAYREELLVQRYLRANVAPEPVGSDMVQAYYDKHPEEFGGGVERTFEVLSTTREVSGQERNEILKQLGMLTQVTDWKKWTDGNSSLSMGYRKATARMDVLEAPLSGLIQSTQVGKVSPVHSGKTIMIARVLDERKLAPKPLQDVSAEIRKKLAPVKLKDAVKTASAQALAQVKVNYEKSPDQEN